MNPMFTPVIYLALVVIVARAEGEKKTLEKRGIVGGLNSGTALTASSSGLGLSSGNIITSGLNLPVDNTIGTNTVAGIKLLSTANTGINVASGLNLLSGIDLNSGSGVSSGLNIGSQISLQTSQAVSAPQPRVVQVDRPILVAVPQQVPVVVDRPVPVTVNRDIAVPVERPVPVPVDRPVPVVVPQPVPVPVSQKVPVPVPSPVPVPVVNNVAIPVAYPVPVVKDIPVLVGTGGFGSGISLGPKIGVGPLFSNKFGAYRR